MSVEWVRLELDVRRFDPDEFAPTVQRVEESGVVLASLDELGDTDEQQYAMFELNKECSADIPGRGPFHSWDEYRRLRIDVPSFRASAVVIAVADGEWIGMAGTTLHPTKGYAFTEMTGVRRAWRGRGVALAMKVRNLGAVGANGLHMIRTVHHPENTGIIRINRRLGYVDATWPYP